MPVGSVKYVHAVARAAKDASGSIEFAGVVTDVTAAKEAERKLRRSEAYLAEAQHLSHTSSWAWDVRRREWAYRSAEVYHLFGFDPEKALCRCKPSGIVFSPKIGAGTSKRRPRHPGESGLRS